MTTGYDEEEEYLRTGNFPISSPSPYSGYGTRALGDPTLRKFLHSQQREGGEEAFQRQQATFNREDRRQQPPPPAPQGTIAALLERTREDSKPFVQPESFTTTPPPILYGSQSPSLPTTYLGMRLPNPDFPDTNQMTGLPEDPAMRAWEPAQTGRWSQRLSPQQVRVRNEADQEMFDTPPIGSNTTPYAKFSELNPWMGPTFDTGHFSWGRGHNRAQIQQDFNTLDWILGLRPSPWPEANPFMEHPLQGGGFGKFPGGQTPYVNDWIIKNTKRWGSNDPISPTAFGTWY